MKLSLNLAMSPFRDGFRRPSWTSTRIVDNAENQVRFGPFPETRTNVAELADKSVLERPGNWVGAHLARGAAIPERAFSVSFEGERLFILPPEKDSLPAVFINARAQSLEATQSKIARFLSAWSWTERSGLRVEQWTSGSRPFRFAGMQGRISTLHFDFEHLPSNLPTRSALALAFYREGLSLDHVAYSFLSFYKVINAVFKERGAQKNWIRDNLQYVRDDRAAARVEELRNDDSIRSVHEYIYTSCRNAVAHSHPDFDVINPDDPTDERRLSSDLPIIRDLARHLIRTEIGLETDEDFWNSKVRRVLGARWMIGEQIVEQIESGAHVGRRSVPLPRKVRLQTRQKQQHERLKNLNMKVSHVSAGCVYLEVEAPDGSFLIHAVLDFNAGEIGIDLLNGIEYYDHDTSLSALTMYDLNEFTFELACNGRLQLIEMETELLIAESKPVIPVNMMLSLEGHKATAAHWTTLADERAKAENEA